MISIIICSRISKIKSGLSKNIKATIGAEFELIVIDSSKNEFSIFEAYNEGLKKSSGAYCCFVHDDILFHTKNWGKIIERIFGKNPKLGLVGIAGAKMKTKMPSAWWRCPADQKYINIIQHSEHVETTHINKGFKDESLERVVVVDGVFMVLRKDEKIYFNTNLKGFHNYDLNISFEYIKRGYHVCVTDQILIEHFSAGSLNKEWVESTFKIHDMYENFLPISLDKVNFKQIEIANAKRFIKKCFKFKKKKTALLVWYRLFKINPIAKFHVKFWINFSAIRRN